MNVDLVSSKHNHITWLDPITVTEMNGKWYLGGGGNYAPLTEKKPPNQIIESIFKWHYKFDEKFNILYQQ